MSSMATILGLQARVFVQYSFLGLRRPQGDLCIPSGLRKNIGQNIAVCSLMWLMPLRSLSNCDYEL